MEQNHGGQGIKWSEQQIGVYHVLRDNLTDRGFAIVLHANLECKVQRSLHGARYPVQTGVVHAMADRPFVLHTLVFSSYLHAWRWYLDDLAQDCRRLVGPTLTS